MIGLEDLHYHLLAKIGYIIASPGYNCSQNGVLKIKIKCVSHFRPQPYHQKYIKSTSASPSAQGRIPGLQTLRISHKQLAQMLIQIYFHRPWFTKHGQLTVNLPMLTLAKRFEDILQALTTLIEVSNQYPSKKYPELSVWLKNLCHY